MKKLTKIFKVTKHQNREVDAHFRQKEKEVMPLAQRSGKIFSDKDLPEPIGDNLSPYIGDIKTICESMIAFIDEQVQAHSHIPEFNTDKKNVLAEEARIYEENIKLSNNLKNIKNELDDIDVEDFDTKIKVVLIISIILCISESTFNTIAFEAIGDNLLFAIALAVPITILILFISHVFGTQVRKIQNPNVKKITIVGVLIAMIPIFYVLGAMRTVVLEKEGTTSIGTLTFLIINYFFFIATAVLSYKYWPTKEESQRHKEYKRLKAEYKKMEKELNNNKKHITNLNSDLNEKAIHINHISYFREYYIDKVIKLYNKAVSTFIKANILNRSDRKTPDCFIEPYPELNITNNFDYHLTTNKN